jgi:hypothetical protein
MVADPGERQIGEHFVAVGQMIEGDGVARGGDAALAGEHNALGAAGGAGSEKDRRRGPAPPRRDRRIKRIGDLCVGERLLSGGDHVFERMEARIGIFGKAAFLVIEDMSEARQALGDGKELVDLLLIQDDSHGDVGLAEDGGEFIGDGVGIDGRRRRAKRLRGGDRPIETRPIGADNGDALAFREAEEAQPLRQRAHLAIGFGPAPAAPDSKVLVPESWPVRPNPRMGAHEFGECVLACALWRWSQPDPSPGRQSQRPTPWSGATAPPLD